jgi:hypothetical protein
MKITRQLMDAVVAGALQQKAVWLAISLNRIVGVMICMSPEGFVFFCCCAIAV